MDPIKKLRIVYNGIWEHLRSCTGDLVLMDAFDHLSAALNQGYLDNDIICYALDVILDWYNDVLDKCNGCSFASYEDEKDYEQHKRNYKLLKEIRDNLSTDDRPSAASAVVIQSNDDSSATTQTNSTPLIFISHRSSDKQYGNALRDFISGLGVPNNRLIYTSHPLHKIPLDRNIYDYLRSNISSNVFMIILWSNQYLESPACLNEMGAAWVVQSDYTNLYVPDFAFGNPKYHECAVDTSKMGAVLNGDAHCRASMLELKDKIVNLFNLQVDEPTLFYLLDKFTADVSAIAGGKT